MGIYRQAKNLVVYGAITVAGLYGLASCHKFESRETQGRLESMADKGLELTEFGLRHTREGIEFLEERVKEARESLNKGDDDGRKKEDE